MPSSPTSRRTGKSADQPRAGHATETPRRSKRPGPPPSRHRPAAAADASTRSLVFAAAALEYSTRGFDGASVDAIARAAHVNKAMLYYHFGSKLGLYREIVRDMLRAVGDAVSAIANRAEPAPRKIERFIEALASQKDARPWFPPLMLREMAEGAPHLDPDTLALLRAVFVAFASILDDGVRHHDFRRVPPLLAYMSIMGPLMMNAVRERAAAQPGRQQHPLFAPVSRDELVAHMQHTALRMLAGHGEAPAEDRRR
jgi:TetR/AcrR family transcriptional regulator